MTDGLFDSLFKELPSEADIARWEAEGARMDAAIRELTEKRQRLDHLINMARSFIDGASSPAPPFAAPVPRRKDGAARKGTWMNTLREIALAHPEGISYADIRSKLPPGLQEAFEKETAPKGFYGGLRRLEREEVIVRHNSHVFTPTGFKLYQERLAAGRIKPVSGPNRGSPISDEIKDYIANHGPSKAVAIKGHLCTFDEFKTPLMRNTSAIYNFLKRLVDRGELLHDTDSATYRLPNQQPHIIEGANKIEAPNGNAASAPTAGEVAASPIENRPLLKLIG